MKKSKGITLIELMIVTLIIGILGSVSFTYYGDFVQKSKRTEARTALQTIAGELEKCRSLYGSYTSASCRVTFPQTTENNLYTVTATTLAASQFTLSAAAVVGQSQATDDCGTYTLTNTNLKGSTGAVADCW